jgi:hypothetical protein
MLPLKQRACYLCYGFLRKVVGYWIQVVGINLSWCVCEVSSDEAFCVAT